MANNSLLEYLSIVMDLETDKYAQAQVIEQLDRNVVSMENEKSTNEDAIKNTPVKYDLDSIEVHPNGIGCFVYIATPFVIAALLMTLSSALYNILGISLSILVYVIVIAVALIACVVIDIIEHKSQKKRLLEEKRAHLLNKAALNREANQKRATRNQELTLSIPTVQKEMEILTVANNETDALLQKYYALNIIPEKYRNLVAVCSFYDYVSSGQTYSIRRNLETHDEGAVNIFERETMMGIIVGKLDQIINNLQALRAEQRAIRFALEEGNRITESLLGSIDSKLSKANDTLASIEYQKEQELKYQQYTAAAAYKYYTK